MQPFEQLKRELIRPFTVGRRNWLFSDSVNGAEASAICYTMVEMAKAYNLNVYSYLKYILENHPVEGDTPELITLLAPWNEEVQKVCGQTANNNTNADSQK